MSNFEWAKNFAIEQIKMSEWKTFSEDKTYLPLHSLKHTFPTQLIE